MKEIEKMNTYNIVFNDNENSNDLGFKESLEFCKNYIKVHNGTNHSYFADYKGGTVSIICNENNQVVFNTKVL